MCNHTKTPLSWKLFRDIKVLQYEKVYLPSSMGGYDSHSLSKYLIQQTISCLEIWGLVMVGGFCTLQFLFYNITLKLQCILFDLLPSPHGMA